MDFWNECPDDVLIAIFKNFDLKTRLKAGLTCQRWYHLLKNPCTNMENVSEISFQIGNDIERWKKKLLQNTLEDIIKNAMEGLSNHVGKAENFKLDEDDPNILSLISKLINDGLLKINKFSSCIGDDFSITILPSSIRELNLSCERDEGQPKLLSCDWALLPQLQRLTLDYISIDLSATSSLSSIKCLEIFWRWRRDEYGNNDQAVVLNTTLSFLPKLEELRISALYFDYQTFRNFLLTIKNKLSNLHRLYFVHVAFDLSDRTAISNEYGFTLDSLEEIEFVNDDWDSSRMDVVKLFSRICPSAIIHLSTRLFSATAEIMAVYDGLAALTARGNTKLALNIDFRDLEDGINDFKLLDTPPEFGQALVKLHVTRMKSTIFLQKFFNCNSYEKLIEIDFDKCDGFNDEILKIVAQSCLWLKKMKISNYKGITENDLKSFLIHWDQRRSKQLTIIVEDSRYGPKSKLPIDRLFGVSFEEGRGILDERWMIEEENENEGRSSIENGKRWALYRKIFKARYDCDDPGIRLVIWDHGYSLIGDQKMLMIKNYGQDSLRINRIDVNPI